MELINTEIGQAKSKHHILMYCLRLTDLSYNSVDKVLREFLQSIHFFTCSTLALIAFLVFERISYQEANAATILETTLVESIIRSVPCLTFLCSEDIVEAQSYQPCIVCEMLSYSEAKP